MIHNLLVEGRAELAHTAAVRHLRGNVLGVHVLHEGGAHGEATLADATRHQRRSVLVALQTT